MTRAKWETGKYKQGPRHGETWHEYGPTRERARELYLKYPLLDASDLAQLLGISRARLYQCVTGLQDARERARMTAYKAMLTDVKRTEGL
jgi:putative heme degradation protein